jgi:tetratricopeptide (TPR) repeat protein
MRYFGKLCQLNGLYLLAIFTSIAATGTAYSGEPDKVKSAILAECAIESPEIGATPAEVRSQIDRLEKLESVCTGTGIYEARLAWLYTLTGRFAESERLINATLMTATGFEKELRSSLTRNKLLSREFDDALASADALVADFPNWAGSYLSLGAVLMEMREYEKAIPELLKANSLEETSGANLLLTMAYYKFGDYAQSGMSLQTSLQQDLSGLRHTDAICAGSLSLLRLGHYDAGLELVRKHLELVPSAKNLPIVETVLRHYEAFANANGLAFDLGNG